MVAIDTDKIGTVDKTTGKTVKVDLDRQLLKPLAGSGKMFCYDSPEYVKDKKMLENGVYKADLFSDL